MDPTLFLIHTTHPCAYWTYKYTLIQSSKRYTHIFAFMPLWLTHSQAHTFPYCTIAPLWSHSARAEALGAAWLSFYQILGPFKWMIPVLRRDQQTKSPLFLLGPLFSSRSSSLILLWKHSCSHLLHQEKKSFFPGFPAGPHPTALFGPSQRNRKPCGVVTWAASHRCVVSLCSWIIGSSQRRTDQERTGLMFLVCISVCVKDKWKVLLL